MIAEQLIKRKRWKIRGQREGTDREKGERGKRESAVDEKTRPRPIKLMASELSCFNVSLFSSPLQYLYYIYLTIAYQSGHILNNLTLAYLSGHILEQLLVYHNCFSGQLAHAHYTHTHPTHTQSHTHTLCLVSCFCL